MLTLQNEYNNMKEKAEETGGSVSTGKGTRTTTFSGKMLKDKLNSGEIK